VAAEGEKKNRTEAIPKKVMNEERIPNTLSPFSEN